MHIFRTYRRKENIIQIVQCNLILKDGYQKHNVPIQNVGAEVETSLWERKEEARGQVQRKMRQNST
jgi:hypothetical protein